MRLCRALQSPLVPIPGGQQLARELQATSTLLDEYPEIAQLAQADLTSGKRTDVGRDGMTGEQVIRVALLKQMHGLSYRELAFHLEDSAAFQAFAHRKRAESTGRYDDRRDQYPRAQRLQSTVGLRPGRDAAAPSRRRRPAGRARAVH